MGQLLVGAFVERGFRAPLEQPRFHLLTEGVFGRARRRFALWAAAVGGCSRCCDHALVAVMLIRGCTCFWEVFSDDAQAPHDVEGDIDFVDVLHDVDLARATESFPGGS